MVLEYLSGFYNLHQSEAVAGALPVHQNNPRKCPLGLYAEQLSGTSFTTPMLKNKKSWMYRIQPSVTHLPYRSFQGCPLFVSDFSTSFATPQQYRWKPMPIPESPTTFLEGIVTIGGSGSPESKTGLAIHLYAATVSMVDCSFCNSDGDLLIVPQMGSLRVVTEFGKLDVRPGEIVVVQRGMHFAVELLDGDARGYICELYEGHLTLPERGPIGANGMANERDFYFPVASFDDKPVDFTVYTKFGGNFFTFEQDHSVFNVVAYHGNYLPYKYDLRNYCAMNSVTYDHPDPSIFTVLTAPTAETGVAVLDLAIFPKRWQVQWDSFSLPYYHRNCMSEFMGNIYGTYEAKEGAFPPGASSLHSCMAAHGPDAQAFKRCTEASNEPKLLPDGISFMFESTYMLKLTPWARNSELVDHDYYKCWQGLGSNFTKQ